MLYSILLDLINSYSFLNVFKYLTFRTGLSVMTSLIIVFVIGGPLIRLFSENMISGPIRQDGPIDHIIKKTGTPTMGGVIIIFSALLPTLMLSNLNNAMIKIVIFSTLWMGVIGFIDDYMKVIIKVKKGMIARYKMIGQISLGIIISYWIINSNQFLYFI